METINFIPTVFEVQKAKDAFLAEMNKHAESIFYLIHTQLICLKKLPYLVLFLLYGLLAENISIRK